MEQGQNPNCYFLNDRAYVLIDTPTMSFPPPGPPMPMPGMPPVPPIIPPPPYAVPPMGGMIPMTVGMMPAPMMAPVPMTVPAAIPMPTHQKLHMKKISHIPYRKHVEIDNHSVPRGPPVTVFVGNITERASDSLVRQLLQRCGTVVNWKRVQGANGRLQAFGFCEYGDPESALRAIRLLHDWQLGERKLVVKVDAKTKEKLDEYKATKWAKQQETGEAKNETKEGEEEKKTDEKPQQSEDTLDEATKQKDMSIKSSIETLLRMHAGELNKPVETKEVPITLPPPPPFLDKVKKVVKPQEGSKPIHDIDKDSRNDLDEMDLDVEKKSLIHREIDKFRDTYKRAEEEREKEKEKERKSKKRDHDSPDSRDRDRDRSERRRSRERNLSRNREERRRRSRERDRKPILRESPARRERERDYRERSRERNDRSRSRSRERDREWSRERDYSAERLRLTVTRSRDNRDKDWEKEEEEVEEAYERKKMQNKLKEKEAAYQERLKNWVLRERRQAKEYEKVRLKAEEQKRDEIKEARRLKEFLEDYDDERDDPKYFKGSALVRRLKEREKEIEADNYDRQKEKEELEELRRKLAEEGHPDPEAEVKKLLQEETRLLQPKLKPETPDSDHEVDIQQQHEAKMKPITKQVSPQAEAEETKAAKQPVEDENTQNSFSGFSDIITTHEEAKPMGFTSLRLGGSPTQQFTTPSTSQVTSVAQSGQKRKITLDEVFSANDDEEAEQKKKRKLIPLDDTQEETKSSTGIAQMTTEEKRKHIKNLIDKIPTAKNELFAYNLDWSVVDKSLMERRIRPWINKKIVEYIGEEEPTLVDFICSKVLAGSSAQSILDDVSMVLDEEAEVFVVKMWRLLIYEIEAKKLGLVR